MLKVWTDGSCIGNPGRGGWACVMTDGEQKAKKVGAEENTTNNRMELLAVINALSAINHHDELTLCTDSEYVKKGVEEWLGEWKRNGWRTSKKKPVANQDLWQRLDALVGKFTIHWEWTRGHSGDEMNELCDTLARNAALGISR